MMTPAISLPLSFESLALTAGSEARARAAARRRALAPLASRRAAARNRVDARIVDAQAPATAWAFGR